MIFRQKMIFDKVQFGFISSIIQDRSGSYYRKERQLPVPPYIGLVPFMMVWYVISPKKSDDLSGVPVFCYLKSKTGTYFVTLNNFVVLNDSDIFFIIIDDNHWLFNHFVILVR